MSGGGVGAGDMVTKGANWRSPENKYKRSKIAFDVTSIALSLGRLGPLLLGLAKQCLTGSPCTLIPGILVCDAPLWRRALVFYVDELIIVSVYVRADTHVIAT